MKHGFSLVELSIVLVILGLLTGGILAGQNLIRAAELRSVSTQIDQYRAASHTFRDKYFALPGDMRNAVRFWGAQAGGTADGTDATCEGLTTPATSQATCNGNGDGKINQVSTGWYERYRFWQHLANAGLIEGSYAGVTAGAIANSESSTAGASANVPRAKINNGAWYMGMWGVQTGSNPDFWAGSFGNAFLVGVNTSGAYSLGPLITAEEAWNIDTKMDDGLPGLGAMVTLAPNLNPNCTTGGTSTTPESAVFNLTDTSIACSLLIKSGF